MGSNRTFFQIYYTNNHARWEELVPYNTFMGLYTFLADKLAWYSWNYADVLIYILARALSFKFQALYRQSEVILDHRKYFQGMQIPILLYHY